MNYGLVFGKIGWARGLQTIWQVSSIDMDEVANMKLGNRTSQSTSSSNPSAICPGASPGIYLSPPTPPLPVPQSHPLPEQTKPGPFSTFPS
ncbi:hypothetical protein QUC31_015349 [Theobroma cacao]